MPEYQLQWVAAKNSANTHQIGTDSTDSFRAGTQTVSAVSGELASISAKNLLQHLIVAAASCDPQHFDPSQLDELWQRWRALPDPEAQATSLVPHLEAGWTWLAAHPDHPEHDRFLERWITQLRAYELAYDEDHVSKEPVAASVPAEGWDGTVPDGCVVPHACRVLGPCPHFTGHTRCWMKEKETTGHDRA